jgi:hypothetical protein
MQKPPHRHSLHFGVIDDHMRVRLHFVRLGGRRAFTASITRKIDLAVGYFLASMHGLRIMNAGERRKPRRNGDAREALNRGEHDYSAGKKQKKTDRTHD